MYCLFFYFNYKNINATSAIRFCLTIMYDNDCMIFLDQIYSLNETRVISSALSPAGFPSPLSHKRREKSISAPMLKWNNWRHKTLPLFLGTYSRVSKTNESCCTRSADNGNINAIDRIHHCSKMCSILLLDENHNPGNNKKDKKKKKNKNRPWRNLLIDAIM